MGVYLWTDESYYPTSSTIAYFPFKDDQLDKSGNGYSINTTGTKQTIGYQFSWSVWITSWWGLPYMISVRAKMVSFGSWITDCATMIRIWKAFRYIRYHNNSNSARKFQLYNSSTSSNMFSSQQSTSTWNRYHLLFWISGGTSWTYACWINGSKVWSWNVNTETGSWNWVVYLMNNNSTWIFSDLILENRLWDDAEVLAYYNSTKSNYWL